MYERRKKFLKNEEEVKRWSEINECYMTEESDSDSGQNVYRHKLSWRSNGWYFQPIHNFS